MPPRLPYYLANTLEFESGFDEPYCLDKLTSVWECSVCEGFPRRPAYIDACPHLFCEACLMEVFKECKEPKDADPRSRHTVQLAPCPNCRRLFSIHQMCPFEHMDQFTQAVIKERQVKCPFHCGFQGNSFEVDEHQVYVCPRRLLQCPNKDCDVIVEAEIMEHVHFPNCTMRRVHCAQCKLSVLATEEESHDCVKRLQSALTSM